MQWTAEELYQQLTRVKPHKAVAPGTLPGVVVKYLAYPLAQWLAAYIQQHWQHQSQIPQQWKDAHLALLAKRTVHSPTWPLTSATKLEPCAR